MKRIFDFLVAGSALLVLCPLLLVLGILVRLRVGSPVFFKQDRPGLNGRIFTLIKFRTMTDATASNGASLPDAERLVPFGRWLRATSLDELPELWNIVRGDMSLVGPRPLLVQYLDRYSPEQARRHETRPGLTGWAQINGRNDQTWDERFALDVWYVDNRSFWLDVKILLITAWKVITREGISEAGEATKKEFFGNRVLNHGDSEVTEG